MIRYLRRLWQTAVPLDTEVWPVTGESGLTPDELAVITAAYTAARAGAVPTPSEVTW